MYLPILQRKWNMKSKMTIVVPLIFAALYLLGCQDTAPTTGGTTSQKVRIAGTVLDINSSMPVSNAVVYRFVAGALADSARTDANGAFAFEFDITGEDSVALTLQLKK